MQLSSLQPNGPIQCSSDDMCDDGMFCDDYGPNPDGQVSSFDDIGHAVLNCYVSITLDWANLMFQLQDSYGSLYLWPYFYLLLFTIAFVILNLVVAVVCNQIISV